MRHFSIALFSLCLAGCSYFKKTPETQPKASDKVGDLHQRESGWLGELNAAGMTDLGDCDLALWVGLAKAAGATVDLSGFESQGAVVRNPHSPCTPVSRDMVLGWGYGEWAGQDLAALQRLADYGEAHNWEMSSDASISSLDPGAQGILGRAIEALSSGADKRGYANNPMLCAALPKDFEQHLQVVEALLGGEVADKLEGHSLALDIPQGCVETLKVLASDSSHDALFAAAVGVYTGDMTQAFSLLLDEGYQCPSYVRGSPVYCSVHKAFAAYTVLRRYQGAAQ